MKTLLTTAAIVAFSAAPTLAGFQSWSVEVDNDPFSKGSRVTVDYSSSMRSGVLIICDTAEHGLTVRAVPGFTFSEQMRGYEPLVEFAIDGERLLGQKGETGSVGDNLAAVETKLETSDAEKFVEAFAAARRQVAVKDGISDRPYLLSARGSTKAGAALVKCMERQAP